MGQFDLTVIIRQEKGFGSLQHTESPALEAGGVFTGFNTVTAGFDPDHANAFIFEKRMEEPDRVAAATDAGHEHIGEPFFPFKNLPPGFLPDHAMKFPDH